MFVCKPSELLLVRIIRPSLSQMEDRGKPRLGDLAGRVVQRPSRPAGHRQASEGSGGVEHQFLLFAPHPHVVPAAVHLLPGPNRLSETEI